MDTNNTMPPQNPAQKASTGPAMSNGAKNMDLYNAITKEDEEVVVVAPKKKASPFMFLVVLFMKITFYFDSVKRSHESFFHFLGGIWAGIMSILYVSGVITLFLSFYSYMRLPLYLENFFEKYNLKYEKLKMEDYSLSKINVFNLHDDENRYKVSQLNVHSTFADFLQGRIRAIVVDGLQINLDQKQENNLEGIFNVLGMIANPTESGLDLKVNSITINNAVLNIEGIENKETKIPINFSMSGLYTNNAQVIIPFAVDEDFLKMEASLAVSGTADNRTLDLTIKSGTLTMANHPSEELQGTASVQLKNNKITDVQSNVNLNYGHGLKTIDLKMTNSENGFNGNASFVYKNTAEKDADLKPLADISMKLENLKIDRSGMETSSPLQIKINRLVRNLMILEGVEGVLDGTMKCTFSNGTCQYDLSQPTLVHYQNIALRYKDQNIFINESGNFFFQPTQSTFIYNILNSEIDLNWNLSSLDLEGFYNIQTSTLNLQTNSCKMQGKFTNMAQKDSLNIDIDGASYQSPSLQMENINLEAKNLLDDTAPIHFSADEVLTSSPLLTIPVSIDLSYLNQRAKANIKVKDSNITMTADGVLKPFQKTFIGEFKILPINLEEVPFTLSELSSLFSQKIKDPSGQVMVWAEELNFSGSTNITGNLYIGLKDVNFHLDETEIEQVNGVIALQSLFPLVSAPKQLISVGKINKLVPFTNIQTVFQLENQAVRLLSVDAQLGQENLTLVNALIPYRTPNALLYLKTSKDFKLDSLLPYLNLTGMKALGGTASLSVPIEISDGFAKVTSTILKVNNVTLQQIPEQKDILGLFKQGNNAYMIRSGQLVLNAEGFLQVDLDGWLMPMRKRQPFAQNDIQLSKPLFKAGHIEPAPSKISNRQKALLQSLERTDSQ